jgi:hypothetical protein
MGSRPVAEVRSELGHYGEQLTTCRSDLVACALTFVWMHDETLALKPA